ncbi:hypothetical protein TSOC_000941 [Tetrabaena socialis]|uniref:Uncharacterized protein n=1 Tax=Tetrabaena socialis TaxID=47790 RepID=A0A2J8AI28_9CHLO|nr:hypothetical protein TSOC_000941 [Tetrabaena socialis]|eukprot:PNH12176.1 hypothetical protein TSOC_000941 [Tetrabaena socialis]
MHGVHVSFPSRSVSASQLVPASVRRARGWPRGSLGRGPAPMPSSTGEGAHSASDPTPATPPTPSPGVLGRIKRFFLGDKMDKEKLAQLGMGAFASYGFLSNLTYGFCLGISWMAFIKAKGVSPLAAGQWPAFLGFYASLWTVQNFVRPLRFSAAIFLAPFFERLILWIAAGTGLPKQWAFALYLVGFALATCAALFGSLYLLGGFP